MQYQQKLCPKDGLLSCILNKYANIDRLKNKNTFVYKDAVKTVFIYNTGQLKKWIERT